jgi:hypothetical protein
MKPLAAIAFAGAVVALAGCTKTLDTNDIANQVGIDKLGYSNVDCPQDVEARQGNNFTCTATTKDGKQIQLQVVQKDDSGHVAVIPVGGASGRTPAPSSSTTTGSSSTTGSTTTGSSSTTSSTTTGSSSTTSGG